LTRRRFEMEGLGAELRVADAESLPFGDASFDLVYSHGVLHHTPDIGRAINEVHRVLKPGGTALVMLYHKNSYNYYVNIMTIRRAGVRLLGLSWGPRLVHALTGEDEGRLRELQRLYRGDRTRLLSREEFLNQNPDGAGNPLARVFTKREVERMFARFAAVRTEAHFLNKNWIPLVGRLIPRSLERRLARAAGWHVWAIANKGES
jgi:ubiquinone/menaquinone biosynthesis C-methylase UbiE